MGPAYWTAVLSLPLRTRRTTSLFCNSLAVDESQQGRGLGRFLLIHAMYLAKERGYRHGAISTAHDNDRAFLFYSNHGFRVADWTYEFSKKLA